MASSARAGAPTVITARRPGSLQGGSPAEEPAEVDAAIPASATERPRPPELAADDRRNGPPSGRIRLRGRRIEGRRGAAAGRLRFTGVLHTGASPSVSPTVTVALTTFCPADCQRPASGFSRRDPGLCLRPLPRQRHHLSLRLNTAADGQSTTTAPAATRAVSLARQREINTQSSLTWRFHATARLTRAAH